MRRSNLLLVMTVLSAGCAGVGANRADEGAGSAEELATRLADAAAAGDRDGMLALVRWEGTSPEIRSSQESAFDRILAASVENVSVEPLPDGYTATRNRNGIEYGPTVEPRGVLVVAFADEAATGMRSLSLPFGEHEGRFWIASRTERVVDPAAGEERSISITVSSGGGPVAVAYRGSCTVLAAAGPRTETVEGQGTETVAVWGHSVRECEVERTADAGWMQLRIAIDGEEVFLSRQEDDGTVEYASRPEG